MVAVQVLEKRTAELKQKEVQIAVLASKVEELETKQAYFESVAARLEALELRANSFIRLTAGKKPRRARLAVFLWVAVALAGCATSKEIYTAEGKRVYSIECRAIFDQSFDCIEKAQELCGEKGFDVLKGSGEPSTRFAKNMVVQCR